VACVTCCVHEHTRTHAQDDDWGLTSYPLIPGHEVVGVVAAVGDDVQGLQAGDRCCRALAAAATALLVLLLLLLLLLLPVPLVCVCVVC
jgi:D-arabinose 1-dehydrogenase-like Zn-dependent alcohol dehydrogenase